MREKVYLMQSGDTHLTITLQWYSIAYANSTQDLVRTYSVCITLPHTHSPFRTFS